MANASSVISNTKNSPTRFQDFYLGEPGHVGGGIVVEFVVVASIRVDDSIAGVSVYEKEVLRTRTCAGGDQH
jgi:hypothetical protein